MELKPTAANLEAIDKAIKRHDANCKAPLTAILLAPFEVDRLGFDSFLGIPIRPDEKMQTGRFRLQCSGQHTGDGEQVEASAEAPKVGELLRAA